MDGALRALQAALIDKAEQHAAHHHAGLYPSAGGPAGHLRPPHAGLCRNVRPRPQPSDRRRGRAQRMSAGRRRPGRHLLPDRPRARRPPHWASTAPAPIRWTPCRTAISPWNFWPAPPSARSICRGWPKSWCCGRPRSSASSACPTASPPARRSCRKSAIPTPPNWSRAKAGRVIGDLNALLIVDEGPAAGLQQGHAGRQGAGLRGCRYPGTVVGGDDRNDRAISLSTRRA